MKRHFLSTILAGGALALALAATNAEAYCLSMDLAKNPAAKTIMQHLIQVEHLYRCDVVSDICYGTNGLIVTCNGTLYTYKIDDKGRDWENPISVLSMPVYPFKE